MQDRASLDRLSGMSLFQQPRATNMFLGDGLSGVQEEGRQGEGARIGERGACGWAVCYFVKPQQLVLTGSNPGYNGSSYRRLSLAATARDPRGTGFARAVRHPPEHLPPRPSDHEPPREREGDDSITAQCLVSESAFTHLYYRKCS